MQNIVEVLGILAGNFRCPFIKSVWVHMKHARYEVSVNKWGSGYRKLQMQLHNEYVSLSVCVCVSVRVCLSVREHYGRSSVGLRHDDEMPRGRGNFGGFLPIGNTLYSIAYAKGITSSPITSRSRRNHSVCPASANNILKISGRRWRGLSTTKGAVGLHRAGEVWYLQLPCSTSDFYLFTWLFFFAAILNYHKLC